MKHIETQRDRTFAIERQIRRETETKSLLPSYHWRRERLWVLAEDVTKVNVEQLPALCHEEDVEVGVADAEDVGDHTVAGWGEGGRETNVGMEMMTKGKIIS